MPSEQKQSAAIDVARLRFLASIDQLLRQAEEARQERDRLLQLLDGGTQKQPREAATR